MHCHMEFEHCHSAEADNSAERSRSVADHKTTDPEHNSAEVLHSQAVHL